MKLLLTSILFFSLLTSDTPNWTFNLEEAKVTAAKENKFILISFSGSDWCKPCIKLEGEVYDTEKFTSYSNKNLALVKADFPRDRKKSNLSKEQLKQNDELAAKYNKKGSFPFEVILDANGNVLGSMGYVSGGPDAFIAKVNSFTTKK